MRIEFFVPFGVVAKQGGRYAVRGGRAIHYQPSRVMRNASLLVTAAREYAPAVPWVGPVEVSYRFQFPWRKAEPMRNRERRMPKDTQPDLGNLEKQMDDVLETAGLIKNDAQIAVRISEKIWCEASGVRVVVEEL